MAVGVAAVVLLTGAAGLQTTRPAPAPTPATTTSAPAAGIRQPAAFKALAAKARKITSVHVKGLAIAESTGQDDDSPKTTKVQFELWVRGRLTKQRLSPPLTEVRVSDGTYVYSFRRRPGSRPQGRRRRLTASNMYHALEAAAVFRDAGGGYANLAAAVKFVPVTADRTYGPKLPGLKWFRLSARTRPPHHLLRGVKEVRIGLSPKDGLARAVVGRSEREGRKTTMVVLFQVVQAGGAAGEDFRLPPEALRAQWMDVDGEEPRPIPPPRQVIAAGL